MEEESSESTLKEVEASDVGNIEAFENPMELLLHLVELSKTKIEEIFVSEVTEKYLEYIRQLDKIDMENAGEFLVTAATLLENKSKALLPRQEIPIEETQEDEGAQLIRRLYEYKLYKEASVELKKQEVLGAFAKPADLAGTEPRYIVKDMSIEGLIRAFSKMLMARRFEDEKGTPKKEIKKDRFTVKDKIASLKEILFEREYVSFFSLFEDDFSKLEMITTFQALLEVLKLQIAEAHQEDVFSDIIVRLKAGAENILYEPVDTREYDTELQEGE